MSAIESVLARRMWFVPDFNVWGTTAGEEIEYLVVEQAPDSAAVFFGTVNAGENAQQVAFADLSDSRGNTLPETIARPRVLIRPRSAERAFIVGEESPEQFKIARDASGSGPVTVDLLVIEMGD